MTDNKEHRRKGNVMEEDINALPLVYGINWDKTIEAEIKADPDLPHIFLRKYSDFRRGRKK